MELADNGCGANIIIAGATARACKEYGTPYIDYPRMLMKAIQTLPKQWQEMPRSSIEELTFGAVSGQLGWLISTCPKHGRYEGLDRDGVGLEAVPESR